MWTTSHADVLHVMLLRCCTTATLQHRSCTRRYLSVVVSSQLVDKSDKNAVDARLSRFQTTRSQEDMEILGERLARGRQAGDVLFLCGCVSSLHLAIATAKLNERHCVCVVVD